MSLDFNITTTNIEEYQLELVKPSFTLILINLLTGILTYVFIACSISTLLLFFVKIFYYIPLKVMIILCIMCVILFIICVTLEIVFIKKFKYELNKQKTKTKNSKGVTIKTYDFNQIKIKFNDFIKEKPENKINTVNDFLSLYLKNSDENIEVKIINKFTNQFKPNYLINKALGEFLKEKIIILN